jgi:hypothetical protein
MLVVILTSQNIHSSSRRFLSEGESGKEHEGKGQLTAHREPPNDCASAPGGDVSSAARDLELPGGINRLPIVSSGKLADKMKKSATSAAAILLPAGCKILHSQLRRSMC